MSLSKYFKDSSSFQREDIVKPLPDKSKGWSADTTSQSAPFEREQNISQEKSQPRKNIQPQEPTQDRTVPPPQPTDSPPPTPPTSPAQSLDLSKYISIEEAEENGQSMYDKGVQDGLQKAAEDYSSATYAFTTSCQQLDAIRETIISNSSDELLEFTLLIAEKILRISLKEQDQTIAATIEEALHRAVKSEEFTIFIHPDDYETIADKSADLVAGVSGLSNIVLKSDPSVEKGGAKIESDNCIIDATISSQFETIRQELFPGRIK